MTGSSVHMPINVPYHHDVAEKGWEWISHLSHMTKGNPQKLYCLVATHLQPDYWKPLYRGRWPKLQIRTGKKKKKNSLQDATVKIQFLITSLRPSVKFKLGWARWPNPSVIKMKHIVKRKRRQLIYSGRYIADFIFLMVGHIYFLSLEWDIWEILSKRH